MKNEIAVVCDDVWIGYLVSVLWHGDRFLCMFTVIVGPSAVHLSRPLLRHMVAVCLGALRPDDAFYPHQVVADTSVAARATFLAAFAAKARYSMHNPVLLDAVAFLVVDVKVSVGGAHEWAAAVALTRIAWTKVKRI